MSLNDTPLSKRIHIGIFGSTNAGKSSVVNAITNQNAALVSDIKGTTTDPVIKSMEMLPIGPVAIIDTPGIDDDGALGKDRTDRTMKMLDKTDIAVLISDATVDMNDYDKNLIELFKERKIKYIVAYNKCDLIENKKDNLIYISAKTGEGIDRLKDEIASLASSKEVQKPLLYGLVEKGDIVVLVTPIDEAAPKGRLILPQQMTIRDCLDHGGVAIVTKETELKQTLGSLSKKPKLVICDSQVFKIVDKIVPRDIPLTSFSILMARYNGYLDMAISGIKSLDNLKDKDKILIAEGCTHHRQCNDIGTVKIPKGLAMYTKKALEINTCSGGDFPKDLSSYSLVIHCGGCMLTPKEVKSRMEYALSHNIPVTNYGILLAHINGILERSIEIFM